MRRHPSHALRRPRLLSRRLATGMALPLTVGIGLAGCTPPDPTLEEQAGALAQRHLIVDTHIDFPIRRHFLPDGARPLQSTGQFDHPRALEGGLNVAFMSIFTPASTAIDGASKELADGLIDAMETIAGEMPDLFGIASCTADVDVLRRAGRLALALGMENGSPLGDEAQHLDHFVARGISYVGLTHSQSNAFSDSSYDPNEPWQGLSALGRQTVRALNARGVMVDVSHLSDNAFWQVLEETRAPIVASHSSLRHFIPGFHRNMSDEMVQAVGAQGGVVQINFGSDFVSGDAQDWAQARRTAFEAAFGDAPPDMEARGAFDAQYRESHPYPFADLNVVLDHIDRVVALAGIDHVGLGSDFDGVGDTLPIGLKDISDYPNLVAGLLRRGYAEDAIARILGGNLMRVWRAVEEHAAALGKPPSCAQVSD